LETGSFERQLQMSHKGDTGAQNFNLGLKISQNTGNCPAF